MKWIGALSVGLVFLVYFFSPVWAESVEVKINQEINSQTKTRLRQEVSQQLKVSRSLPAEVITKKATLRLSQAPPAAAKAAVCARLENRIQQRLDQYASHKDKWSSRHQGIVKRLEDLADKMEARGCDVSTLRANLQTYQNLIEAFAAAFRDFHASLQGSQTYACGESEGQFVAQVQESQPKLALVKQRASELHTFVQTTLRTRLTEMNRLCPTVAPTL